jgi:hypothetical protein
MRTRPWVLCLVLTGLAASARAQLPLGPEFRVNAYTTYDQIASSIAADGAGNFVVVWESDYQDGDSGGIFARKHLASGAPLGSSEFRVNAYTTGWQGVPSVASDPTGRLVVVWQSDLQDGAGSGVFGRRFDAAGLPGPEFRVNSSTTGSQSRPRVAMDASGNFVVAWNSVDGLPGSRAKIFAQRYNTAGVPQGGEFQVDGETTQGSSSGATVSADPTGNFVIAWSGYRGAGALEEIFARRYTANAVPIGGAFQVNSYTPGFQAEPSLAVAADGAFLVVWDGAFGQDGDFPGVFAQKFDASGVRQGSEFQVNQYTTSQQITPRVSADASGAFTVVWMSYAQDGSDFGVFARVLTRAGTPEGGEFQVNTVTAGRQSYPAVVAQPSGRFVVAWQTYAGGPVLGDVAARRFARDFIFHDGFESGDLLAWSSAATGTGDLSPSVLGAMKSTSVGLQGVVDDTASLYVQDDTPADENSYRARFYVDTDDFDPGQASGAHRTRVFIAFEEAPTRRLAAVVLKRQVDQFSIEGRARLDGGAQADTGFFDITPGQHVVEIRWQRSTGPSANDGLFQLWIDGTSRSTLAGLANSQSAVDFVRLGALNVKATANGTLFWDEFESRRQSFIGN